MICNEEKYMDIIEKSLSIALEAHTGQVDRAGEPYILHPLRVMAKMTTDLEKATALLHDVIEDSSHTRETLEKAGIPHIVIDAVGVLTRAPGQAYSEYITALMWNVTARAVKIADLEDNMNVLRLGGLTNSDLRRVEKYHLAWIRLSG